MWLVDYLIVTYDITLFYFKLNAKQFLALLILFLLKFNNISEWTIRKYIYGLISIKVLQL